MPSQPSSPLPSPPPPSPVEAAADAEITSERLAAWSQLYGVEHRQLRRWIARGREKGEPCPLDRPADMPAWIDKHLEKIRSAMRDKVSAAAEAARVQAAPAPPPADQPAINAPPAAASSSPAPPGAATPTVAPLDLATVGGVEGESVAFFRKMFSAVKLQLEEAYEAGNEDRIRTLHARLEKVGESLRKHEISAEARARRRGELLEKAEVLNEVTQLLTTLKLMHEQMGTRIAGELTDLDAATRERLRAVIVRERGRELQLLRTLSAFRSPDDVLLELAA